MTTRLITAIALALGLAGPALAERLTDAPLVDTGWLADHLDHADLAVLDVRPPADGRDVFAEGHVPGALSAPYGAFGWRTTVDGTPGMLPPVDAIAERIGSLGIDADTHVVIVPEGTDSTEFGRATRVYWTFKVLGHDAVAILDGGFRAWEAAGLAQETGTAEAPEPAAFAAELRPELLAEETEVQAALDGSVVFVDGRPETQYRGQDKSPVVRTAGTLPGAVNIPHSRLYDGTRFATGEEVRAMLAEAGVDPDAPVYTFCNTGHWASIPWFAISEVAGRADTAMYDGSMAQWTRDPENPVELLN